MLVRDVLNYKMKTREKKDITKDVQGIIDKYGLQEGLCNIFLKATTAALLMNEDDKMLVADFEKLLDQLAPDNKFYHHPQNAQSHLRAMLFSNNLTIPVANGKLLLGTWQSILLWEFDLEERERLVVVTMMI